MTTTLYTLTAYAKVGRTPASHSATTAARVVKASEVTSFTATPGDIDQGQAVTLSWSGDALSWAIKADTDAEPITMGPRRTVVVQPAQTTTYTLLATGPAGTTSGGSVTVKVAPTAPTSLSASAPDTPAPLRLEASCTAETCKLSLIATASVSLRGVALNLPIDASKVSVGPVTLDPAAFPAPSTGAVKLGFGPLQNVLVLGAAIQGSGAAAAQDAQLASGAHLLDFDLTLQPSGGVGKVFDGAAAQSWLQGALGRTSNAIAVGKLSAQ
jgi:hypothetical protein